MVVVRVLVIGSAGCGLVGLTARASEQAGPADKPTAKAAEAGSNQAKVEAPVEVVETKWPNGNPQSRTEGKKDEDGEFIRHGTATVWYENGQKKSEQQFADGEPHGPRSTWYIEGRKWTEGSYANGLEDGTWRAWYPDGTPQNEWTMVRGVWHGVYSEWHPNGKKRMEVEFVKGKRQGPMTVSDDQGVVMLTTDYVDGIEQP
jgi:antitoxin component YwqK of YwqJK toxin-antitoxin module